MKKRITGYGIKNFDTLLADFFFYRRDAVSYAKKLVDPGDKWRDVFTIVKVRLEEL